MRILCVTPNIAIDRTLRVPGFAEGGVWRAVSVYAACGGKGINVARALARMGHQALSAGLLAGETGKMASQRARSEGLEASWTWVGGESRTCVIIIGDGGRTTVINEPGPVITAVDWSRFVADVGDASFATDGACISGSMPPGMPPGGMASLIAAAGGNGRPVWVDTSGAVLVDAVAARPAGIKINGPEAQALLGRPVTSAVEALAAAREIRAQGVARVAVTLGSNGAVLSSAEGEWRARPPAVAVINAVGSGDCFLAGLVGHLLAGAPPAEALRWAVAAGAANAATATAGGFERSSLDRLMQATEVVPVEQASPGLANGPGGRG
jgi:1-phosphofructokinase family hexose kinase